MPQTIQDRLYELLPALYRIQDAEQGQYALKGMLSIIEEEVEAIHLDIDNLYENWFIETCEDWVVPYIGDLLGVTPLEPVDGEGYTARAYVANTLAYRQAKGTLALLEALAADVTGHTSRAVEFFRLLATTPHLNHVRTEAAATVDLRDSARLDLIQTPFDPTYRTAEVRRISTGRGRYNVPNIGLFLWRLESYPLTGVPVRPVTGGGYTFNNFGRDASLFNIPDTEESITGLAEERHVETPLRRRALYDELEDLRARLGEPGVDEEEVASAWIERSAFFEPGRAAFHVAVRRTDGDDLDPVDYRNVRICDLSTWRRPPALVADDPFSVMVDPELGRLTVPEGEDPSDVIVDYAYGFSGDLGGGPYERDDDVDAMLEDVLSPSTLPLADRINWQIGVSKTETVVGSETIVSTLTEAVQEWNSFAQGRSDADEHTTGVIVLMDSGTYEKDIDGADRLLIPERCTLMIVAARWEGRPVEDAPPERRRGDWDAAHVRPHLLGDLSIRGTAGAVSRDPGSLLISGLSVEGELRILDGHLGRLHLSHCSIAADRGSEEMRPSVVEVKPSVRMGRQNTLLQVVLDACVCGPIGLPDTVPTLRLRDTILDATLGKRFIAPPPDGDAPAWTPDSVLYAPGSRVTIETCTLFGEASVYHMEARDTLFTRRLVVERRQSGCIRYSYLASESLTPRRYRCQPESQASDRVEQAEKRARAAGLVLSEIEADAIRSRTAVEIVPRFTTRRFGAPAYAQLRHDTPAAIRAGSSRGGEMGAFAALSLTQREANLLTTLDEYLRLGIEAGILYAT